MKVKIKKLNPNAVIPYKATSGDHCYDCVAVSEEEVAPNIWKYGLGFALEIVCDDDLPFISLSIDARPRSSIYKTGMLLSNAPGTVDEDYRGEVCAVFYHVMPNMPRYKVGDRIVQIKLGCSENIDFEEVDELSETDRGTGGFGSTGK